MDALKAIMTRRSVRSFTGDSLEPETLETILRAGMQAPSAHGRRSWRMLTVTSREKMAELIPLSPWWGLLDRTGALIVVCSDKRGQEDISHEFQVDGCAAAAENMLLAAHALGLGGVWLGVCEGERGCREVKERLSIPDYADLVCMLAIGVPSAPSPADLGDADAEREAAGEKADLPQRWEGCKWFKECWGATAYMDE